MGCAGSKPHHLLSSSINSHHHHKEINSPQKGFILFNAKTIEYLKANEEDIKQKLVKRCEQRMTNLKVKKNSTDESTETTLRMSMIESSVDYVLKYAINDFNIENFKSSNHLSMKQIRKDIMKKYSSQSRLNTSNSSAASSTTSASNNNLFKTSLNNAIDEFGLFIQENFIIINEFEAKKLIEVDNKKQQEEVHETSKEVVEGQVESVEQTVDNLQEEQDALKLKEALELARQNFYKGKISMVCLNKKGGYVVKEVNEENKQQDDLVIMTENQIKSLNDSALSGSNQPDLFSNQVKSVSNISIKSLSLNSNKDVNKSKILTDTIDLIVKYSTRSAENINLEKYLEEQEENLSESEIYSTDIDLLSKNLTETKIIIEALNKESEVQDSKLLESIINLDYVNKEFKNYLIILDTNLKQQLDKVDKLILNENQNDDLLNQKYTNFKDTFLLNLIEKNSNIKKIVEQIDSLVCGLPKSLFNTKNLPHPSDSDHKLNKEEHESDENCKIDIKKEIAFSILNVGEVLAKTIDYYTLDTNQEKTELVKISEEQSEMENKSEQIDEQTVAKTEELVITTELVDDNQEQVSKPEVENSQNNNPKSQESLASTLSSPSLSSSSVSPSGSISPVQQQSLQSELQQPQDRSERLTEEPKRPEYELIEQVKSTSLSSQIEHHQGIIKQDITCLEVSNESQQINQKSSSSSSDILNEESNSLVQEFISNIIESAAQKFSSEADKDEIVYRNKMNGGQSRMSLNEELLYQLEDVDKKVKYMNETCSENEGDDDDDDDDEDEDENLDDENFDYDESVECENDEKLFHPRRPAKIKSELRKNRAIDLHEEIKQISNVIQDLVQTINVRNVEQSESKMEDNTSQNRKSLSIQSRKSLSNSINSSIPVRQKVLTKQKATSIEDELCDSFKTAQSPSSVVIESYVDFSNSLQIEPKTPEIQSNKSNKILTNSSSSQNRKSRLPVKK